MKWIIQLFKTSILESGLTRSKNMLNYFATLSLNNNKNVIDIAFKH